MNYPAPNYAVPTSPTAKNDKCSRICVGILVCICFSVFVLAPIGLIIGLAVGLGGKGNSASTSCAGCISGGGRAIT
ncbi:unnamed protein product [Adineta steineri]|uniref:Uncharacterized protein n=1 Tax=Adineta steineri TaxID=433720 RepID=A0A814C5G0_9BILA|nr:unnamed protein product [Adineta steineri]CAF1036589.1 unnamed protein product [Adineta steineri]CAF1170641.1 unnamed protein product [Adineta steineri]CAF3668469.1 unnamed protein product [Adineta steineri]CAF3808121.1 unnamed protein product [Adineta steineri]